MAKTQKSTQISIEEYLEELKSECLENLNDLSREFLDNYNYNNINYLSDAISDFADDVVDIYNYDLFEWCKNNYDYVEEALKIFGFSKDFHGEPDLIKTIQAGQFLYNEELIREDLKEITEILVINFLLDNLEKIENLSTDEIDNIINDLKNDVEKWDKIDFDDNIFNFEEV